MKLPHYLHIRNHWKHALWFNLGAILLILLGAEGICRWLEAKASSAQERIRTERVYEVIPDDLVGGRLAPDTRRLTRKYADGRLIYEAVVTTDPHGLRIAPPCGACDSAVLFFGDSFTYGEGVDDTATMPWRVGLRARDRYRTYNFAVHGYGPHQMLSLVEHGRVDPIVEEPVACVIYQAIYPEHVHRLMGHYSWNAHGPRYALKEDGTLRFMGPFDQQPRPSWHQAMEKSALGRRILSYAPRAGERDKALFVAVVCRTSELLRQRWPGARFHLIVWDWTDGADSLWFRQISGAGIQVHDIRDILPDGNKSNLAYKISPDDKHPNPQTHQLIADYVTRNVLGLDVP